MLDNSAARLVLRAVDGYTVNISLADAQNRMIVATHLITRPWHLGFWAAVGCIRRRRSSHLPAKTLKERFALCPWGLYHIDVQKSLRC